MFEVTDKYIYLVVNDKRIGYILYDEQEDKIIGSYIFVDETERGKGYAQKLVEYFTEFSKTKDKKIKPVCPVIKRLLEASYPEFIYR
ncbi:MAG: N-acetyltransferase [Bacilli bacterium]|nr:N-acetyltransferase [Bacilli bacterium]